MRKNACRGALLLLIGFGLWFGIRGATSQERELASSRSPAGPGGARGSADSGAPGGFKTKAGLREPAAPRATHGPQSLKEFMLPAITIDGLALEAALRKLMEAYQEACGKTGETALALKFIVPAGGSKKIHLHLSGRNFDSSVQLLASLSGMTVSRRDRNYHFERIVDARAQVSREIKVPADLSATLNELAGQQVTLDLPHFSALVGTPQTPVKELIRRLPTARVNRSRPASFIASNWIVMPLSNNRILSAVA